MLPPPGITFKGFQAVADVRASCFTLYQDLKARGEPKGLWTIFKEAATALQDVAADLDRHDLVLHESGRNGQPLSELERGIEKIQRELRSERRVPDGLERLVFERLVSNTAPRTVVGR